MPLAGKEMYSLGPLLGGLSHTLFVRAYKKKIIKISQNP